MCMPDSGSEISHGGFWWAVFVERILVAVVGERICMEYLYCGCWWRMCMADSRGEFVWRICMADSRGEFV